MRSATKRGSRGNIPQNAPCVEDRQNCTVQAAKPHICREISSSSPSYQGLLVHLSQQQPPTDLIILHCIYRNRHKTKWEPLELVTPIPTPTSCVKEELSQARTRLGVTGLTSRYHRTIFRPLLRLNSLHPIDHRSPPNAHSNLPILFHQQNLLLSLSLASRTIITTLPLLFPCCRTPAAFLLTCQTFGNTRLIIRSQVRLRPSLLQSGCNTPSPLTIDH